MTIKSDVNFIDACDLLKCRLSRMLAIVSAAQQEAMRASTLTENAQHKFSAGIYLAPLLDARNEVLNGVDKFVRAGGQE